MHAPSVLNYAMLQCLQNNGFMLSPMCHYALSKFHDHTITIAVQLGTYKDQRAYSNHSNAVLEYVWTANQLSWIMTTYEWWGIMLLENTDKLLLHDHEALASLHITIMIELCSMHTSADIFLPSLIPKTLPCRSCSRGETFFKNLGVAVEWLGFLHGCEIKSGNGLRTRLEQA